MSNWRRYEILLPTRLNNGQPIPDEALGETLSALRGRFGAVSWDSQPVRGRWDHAGSTYEDDSVRVLMDVPDTEANREFFRAFKEKLKERFEQIDIWMTHHPIEIV